MFDLYSGHWNWHTTYISRHHEGKTLCLALAVKTSISWWPKGFSKRSEKRTVWCLLMGEEDCPLLNVRIFARLLMFLDPMDTCWLRRENSAWIETSPSPWFLGVMVQWGNRRPVGDPIKATEDRHSLYSWGVIKCFCLSWAKCKGPWHHLFLFSLYVGPHAVFRWFGVYWNANLGVRTSKGSPLKPSYQPAEESTKRSKEAGAMLQNDVGRPSDQGGIYRWMWTAILCDLYSKLWKLVLSFPRKHLTMLAFARKTMLLDHRGIFCISICCGGSWT